MSKKSPLTGSSGAASQMQNFDLAGFLAGRSNAPAEQPAPAANQFSAPASTAFAPGQQPAPVENVSQGTAVTSAQGRVDPEQIPSVPTSRDVPAQFYLVSTLASVLEGDLNTPEQRERVAMLANGPFGRMCIHPRALRHAAPIGWSAKDTRASASSAPASVLAMLSSPAFTMRG